MELFQIIGAMMEKECHQNMPFFTVRWLKYQRLGNYYSNYRNSAKNDRIYYQRYLTNTKNKHRLKIEIF